MDYRERFLITPSFPITQDLIFLQNPFTGQPAPTGPGFRLPFTVISPWTRGGIVFTEPSDHISQTLFLEQWAAARV